MLHQILTRVRAVSFLLSGLSLSPFLFADSSDWVQVDRYNKQLKLAREGEPAAMYEVGRMLERGRGTSKNMSKAAQWYQQAIEYDYAAAQARLGIMYVEGRGVKQNTDKALQLLQAASVKDIPSAQYQLATMYELGAGIDIDISKAIHWYQKAAQGGYVQAQNKVQELRAISTVPEQFQASLNDKSRQSANVHPTVIVLLKGKWARSGQPAGYLPSSASNCRLTSNNYLKCISTARERSTGTEVISYSTTATITNFRNNKFVIRYVNNVLEVETLKDNEPGLEEDDDDDDDSQNSESRIKTGKQEKIHLLQCILKNNHTVECNKNNTRTYVFNSIAG